MKSIQTKPEIGLKLLQVAVERDSLPFQWLAADELYGDSPAFRDGVALLNKWYFTEIKRTTQVWPARPEVFVPDWSGRGRRPTRLHNPTEKATTVHERVAQVPNQTWQRAAIKEGSKGPILCDFAFLRILESRGGLPAAPVWLVIRRNLEQSDEVKFYFSNDTPKNATTLLTCPTASPNWHALRLLLPILRCNTNRVDSTSHDM